MTANVGGAGELSRRQRFGTASAPTRVPYDFRTQTDRLSVIHCVLKTQQSEFRAKRYSAVGISVAPYATTRIRSAGRRQRSTVEAVDIEQIARGLVREYALPLTVR